MKRKHIIPLFATVITLILLWPGDASAQRISNRVFRFQNRIEHDQRPYHFGFTLGFNSMQFAVKPAEDLQETHGFQHVLVEPDFGFHIGIVSNLKLTDFLDLRFVPTISFADRHIEYYTDYYSYGPDGDASYDERQELEVTMLEFPFHIKYKSERMLNTRAYVLGGFKYTHDLASIEHATSGGTGNVLARVARNDLHYEVGVGFDHYFYFFKFSTEVKASFGMGNLVRDGDDNARYYDSINRLSDRAIMISLLFE